MFRRILLILALAVITAGVTIFGVNRFSLEVCLTGENSVLLEYGDNYQDPGAFIRLRGTLFFREGVYPEQATLKVENPLQEQKLGKYTICYRANFLWLDAEAERTVSVIDSQCPVITLTEDSSEKQNPGTVYTESGFQAWDNYDGDITDRVIRTEEMGKIIYAVTDSSGNPAMIERIVPYHDPIPPQIVLEGGTDYRIPTGRPFREPGYTATDNVDGDLTEKVSVEGTVDWLRPGSYPIRYTVTDAYGNAVQVIRNVQVQAAERPETLWPQGRTIYLTFDDGPGPYTESLLDVLDSYGVKATFFVTDSDYGYLMREITDRGHSIGIHSVTHNYAEIYASAEAYFEDLFAMQQIIYKNTGVHTTLMRFPGGSSNEVSIRSCKGIMTFLTEAVQDAGFRYFDWNVDSDDAGLARKKKTVADNVKQGISEEGIGLVLQHDIHPYSVAAVEEIIRWGLDNGYQFLPLEENSPNFPHPLNN